MGITNFCLKILITGIGGNVASNLAERLTAKGHSIVPLSRRSIADFPGAITWDDMASGSQVFPGDIDAVVHLAGASIATTRWNKRGRKKILLSRVQTASLLFDAFRNAGYFPEVFISASAIGFYDDFPGLPPATEGDAPGTGFLSKVCVEWEAQAERFREAGCRVVIMRLANILMPKAGIMAVFTRLVRWRLMIVPSSGKQIFCWVHQSDVCRFVEFAIGNPRVAGTFNLASDNQPEMGVFIRTLASTIYRHFWLPEISSGIIRFVLGKKSTLILGGRPVETTNLSKTGFSFQFKHYTDAMNNCMNKKV